MAKASGQPTADSASGIEELAEKLKFSFATGNIWLGEERMILLHRAALGSFRKELVTPWAWSGRAAC